MNVRIHLSSFSYKVISFLSDDLPKQATKTKHPSVASVTTCISYDHILVAVCSALVYWRPSTSTPVEASLTDLGDVLPPLAPARLGKLAKSTECGRSLSNPSTSPWLGLGVAVGQRHADEFRSVCKMPYRIQPQHAELYQHTGLQVFGRRLRLATALSCCAR